MVSNSLLAAASKEFRACKCFRTTGYVKALFAEALAAVEPIATPAADAAPIVYTRAQCIAAAVAPLRPRPADIAVENMSV
jgi:hypothetical protein